MNFWEDDYFAYWREADETVKFKYWSPDLINDELVIDGALLRHPLSDGKL
jgi:hypothetical protein